MKVKLVVLLCLFSLTLQMSGLECNVPNCELCNAPNVCEACSENYSLLFIDASQEKTCIRHHCPENCLTCNSTNECEKCDHDFLLTEMGFCQSVNIANSEEPTIRRLDQLPMNQTIYSSNCTLSGCSVCENSTACTTCKDKFQLLSNKQCLSCNVPNCKSCSTADFCTQCTSTSYSLSPFGNGCFLCNMNLTTLTGCQACLLDNECGQCTTGLQLYFPAANSAGVCIKCSIQNCQICAYASTSNTSVVCSVCAEGYSVSPNKDSCIICAFPCDTCTTAVGPNNCASCVTPLYYKNANSNGTCIKKKIPGCGEVSSTDSSLCSQCETGYEKSSDSTKCTWGCPINCETCTNKTFCSQCVKGFRRTTSGSCSKCATKGCSVCSDDGVTCTTCLKGFYLLSQECKNCPGFCSDCTSASTCSELVLVLNQVLIMIDGKSVLAVCDSNCLTCSNLNPEICTVCMDGYILKKGRCKKCSGSCKTCDQSDKTLCLTCYPNTFLSGTTCKSCNSKCKTCSDASNPDKCTSCRDGYYLSSNDCIKGCPENCFTCASGTTCTQCLSGFTLFEEDGQFICAPCVTSCRTCAEGQPASCLTCGAGFYQNGASCTKCSSNCDACTSAGCTTCAYGYFMTSEMTCAESCMLPCSTCDVLNPSSCLDCIAGYKYNDQTKTCEQVTKCSSLCVVCPMGYSLKEGECKKCQTANCKSCNADSLTECYNCKPKFYLNDAGSCVACSSQCKTCLSETGCLTCADGYTIKENAVATAGGYECVKCNSPCLKCSGSPDMCTECMEGYNFYDGWKCVQKFRFSFKIKLNIVLKLFNTNFLKFLRQLSGAIKGSSTNAITCSNIYEGSVNIDGSAAPSGGQGSTQAADQYAGLNALLSSGSVGGMSVQESSLSISEGSVGSVTQDSKNYTGLILGICIPVGLLVIVGIISAIVYNQRKNKKGSDHQDFKQGSENKLKHEDKMEFI